MHYTDGQIMSWYHAKMRRIPHCLQNPTKNYIADDELEELCDGTFIIQEKVDGKLSCSSWMYNEAKITDIIEDMTSKNTCHNHVMNYNWLPANKRIHLERIVQLPNREPFVYNHQPDLNYAIVTLSCPSIEQIHTILEGFSKMHSHFGSSEIEGLVIKKFVDRVPFEEMIEHKLHPTMKVKMAKWVNQKFEDKVHGVE